MLFRTFVFVAAASAGAFVNAAVIGVIRALAPDEIHPWALVSGRDTNSILEPYPRDNVLAEDPTKSSEGGVIVYGPRDKEITSVGRTCTSGRPMHNHDPTVLAEDPTKPLCGGVIVCGPRDTIPA
ncbi:hypothetical protein B0H19DRAFT_1068818 [Mycena capillaripes]|nr:hypothetical protein B0H19DRAFT_1068818 [Mycena capillaripes]